MDRLPTEIWDRIIRFVEPTGFDPPMAGKLPPNYESLQQVSYLAKETVRRIAVPPGATPVYTWRGRQETTESFLQMINRDDIVRIRITFPPGPDGMQVTDDDVDQFIEMANRIPEPLLNMPPKTLEIYYLSDNEDYFPVTFGELIPSLRALNIDKILVSASNPTMADILMFSMASGIEHLPRLREIRAQFTVILPIQTTDIQFRDTIIWDDGEFVRHARDFPGAIRNNWDRPLHLIPFHRDTTRTSFLRTLELVPTWIKFRIVQLHVEGRYWHDEEDDDSYEEQQMVLQSIRNNTTAHQRIFEIHRITIDIYDLDREENGKYETDEIGIESVRSDLLTLQLMLCVGVQPTLVIINDFINDDGGVVGENRFLKPAVQEQLRGVVAGIFPASRLELRRRQPNDEYNYDFD